MVGVENATGVNGTPFSCFTASVADGSAVQFRRFANPTVVFSDDVEAGVGAWTSTGLWHRVMQPDCSPASRSREFSWYYGQDPSCTDGRRRPIPTWM